MDVLAVMDSLHLADSSQRPDLARARAAVAELIERGRKLQHKAGRHEWAMFAEAMKGVQAVSHE